MKTIGNCGKFAAVVSALFLLSTAAFAQDDDGGPQTQGDDAEYLSITVVDFKPGMRTAAMQIIAESFVPATEKSGVAGPILTIHFQTGPWDLGLVWAMEGGMADLEWFTSADDIKWRAALAEIAGGEDEADALWASFQSMVASSVTNVGHHHIPEAE